MQQQDHSRPHERESTVAGSGEVGKRRPARPRGLESTGRRRPDRPVARIYLSKPSMIPRTRVANRAMPPRRREVGMHPAAN
jgi:hypothetical protein